LRGGRRNDAAAAERRPREIKKSNQRLFFAPAPQKECGEKRKGVFPRGAPEARQ
jgi:hypothetical protein